MEIEGEKSRSIHRYGVSHEKFTDRGRDRPVNSLRFHFFHFLFLFPIAFVSQPTLPSRASITATNEMAISGQTTWRSSVIRDYRSVSD